MKRVGLLLVLLLGAAGCRDVLGIQELGLVDGATDGPSDEDGPTDAEMGPPVDCGDGKGMACTSCCRMTYASAYGELQMKAQMAPGCICGLAAPCQAACSGSVCADPPSNVQEPNCGPCIDAQLLKASAACTVVLAECNAEKSCQVAVDCLTACR